MLPLARLQTNSSVTIPWNPLPGASTYDIWIDNITTGQTYARGEVGPSASHTASFPAGVYKAWVRGVTRGPGSIYGLFSFATEFVVLPAPVVPLFPLNSYSTFNRQPTFQWNGVAGAVSYDIVVRDANTGLNAATGTNILETSWTPPADLPVGAYRWFVKAVSADGYKSSASSLIDFFIGGRTEVLTPTGTTSDRTPTFTWRPVDGADAYTVQVDRLDVPTVRAIFVTSLSPKTVFTPPTPLKPGTYRVWVRAIETFGELSPWSKAVDFTVTQSAEPDRQTLVPMLAASDVPSV